MSIRNYQRLCSLFYDHDKPEAQSPEVDFFAEHITRSRRGLALEAMCGSGRLLIPLLKRGLSVEGVDYSPHMLKRLRERCLEARVIPPVFYQQSLSELNLPNRYAVIFIALGSFQLLAPSEAFSSLTRLHAHLLQGGRLVIDTFVPWDLIETSHAFRSTQRKVVFGKETIVLKSDVVIDRPSQRYLQKNHYELQENGVAGEIEEEELHVRWYFPEEFTELLRKAGFSPICHSIPPSSSPPRRFIYDAVRVD